MNRMKPRSLGILLLDRGLPPGAPVPPLALAPMRNPATFHFPTTYQTVEGAFAPSVIQGDSTIRHRCIDAARRLVDQGAVAISSNCGFFVRFQADVAAAVDVPVVLSSLLLTPSLLRQLPETAKLAIITADSTQCTDDLLGLEDSQSRSRVVVGGVEGGQLWKNEMQVPPLPTTVAEIEADVIACVSRLRAAHPDIGAILFECTGFPLVTGLIRRKTGLPVLDITTLCRAAFESVATLE